MIFLKTSTILYSFLGKVQYYILGSARNEIYVWSSRYRKKEWKSYYWNSHAKFIIYKWSWGKFGPVLKKKNAEYWEKSKINEKQNWTEHHPMDT